uniref:Integrase catalytic domain-containing protein n=1 Tax=Tanacetum cinerariifolium TaxID=118510 RepID=A0A6L2LQ77_TANCI|nr:hypothetical protein [Tanacetum cinerariifolium]
MYYLTDCEKIDRGYVAFGGNPKGGKIIGKSLIEKMYCLVVIDDYSRFTCVFFLTTKDETNGILKSFITRIENLVDHKVKVIRCDNETEFKNREMNQLCKMKGIMRQFSVAKTPQQNEVVERRNRTLIEAAKTMLADLKLPTIFWVEVVNTACYVQNRVLVVKPHNKTPYELFHGRTPTLSFMRPFECPVTILNTEDHLVKLDGKADKGFFVRYYVNSKAFRVFNNKTRIVEENLHIRFSENTPNVVGSRPDWLFDIDTLTRTINYEPIVACTRSNGFADLKSSQDNGCKPSSDDGKKVDEDPSKENECKDKEKENNVNNTNNVNTISSTVNTASTDKINAIGELPFDPDMPALEDIGTFDFSNEDEDDDAVVDMKNLDTTIQVSHTLTTRIYKNHPLNQVIGDLHSSTQTRKMSKNLEEHEFVSTIQQRTNHKDLQNCLFACFLSQKEPKKTLVDLPNGKRAIGTKWVFKNKKDEKGIMIRNKTRLVSQGHTQEERIDYDEVFAPVARIKAIRLFLAYASLKDFVVYQMNVKSAFLYEKIKEVVYVCQPPGFEDIDFPDRLYKVKKALYGLHQAPRAWYETLSTYLLDNGFQRGKINKTLFIKRHKGAYTDSDYAGASLDRKSTTEDIRHHFIRDCNEKKLIQMVKIHTDKNVADLLTKAFDELSYNQNYNGNYYSHDLLSFPCCDNCEESHENFQCQPIAQNIDFSGSDQIQTPQYPDVHLPSQEISYEVFQANHSIQNEESVENLSNQIAVSNPNQEKEEPAQESEIHQLIEECGTEICEEQKQSMKDTMLELVKICQEKEFLCIHDDVDDLVESARNSKLLLINSNSQHLDKKEQKVKNVVEQPAKRRNRNIQSLQNFRVVHKNSISLNTSQIYSIHAIAPILSTKEPEHLLSMGYEHLSITPETESDEVTESNAENLLPIPSKCEVTLEDKKECDVPIFENSPVCDDHSDIFSDSKIDDDILVYDDDFEDIEYVEASLPDPEIVSVEEENGVEEENDERLSNLVKSNISSNNPLLEEADLFLASDNSIPPGSENFADDTEGDIRFLEELFIDDSILSHESSDSNFEENPSVPQPPPKPPDVETDAERNSSHDKR